ncbi:hypothetical protein FAI41_04495 [Acetobacteraceae bacterium]|nr:hypothetical protein FAI41_04495 [Acetobacteraceae bacterium]
MSFSENAPPLMRSSPREAEIYQAVGDWVSSCLGEGFTVLQGQQNRTPPPLGNFVTMVISNKNRLSTNARQYQADQNVLVSASFLFTLEVTCIGKDSGEAVMLLKTLWRDLSCCEFFQKYLPSCAPVDSDLPHQEPLLTAEKQYEDKWALALHLNVLMKTILQQETMNNIHLKITKI